MRCFTAATAVCSRPLGGPRAAQVSSKPCTSAGLTKVLTAQRSTLFPCVARPAAGLQLVEQASDTVFELMTISRPDTVAAVEDETRGGPEDEFNANFGRAVRVLREDLPRFFLRPPRMEIFTDDVGFVDEAIGPKLALPTHVQGRANYEKHLWLLRFHARIFFSKTEVDILRMWQRETGVLSVRWTLRSAPRLVNGLLGSNIYLDGVSEYYFDRSGHIFLHKVDNVNWNGLKLGMKQQKDLAYDVMLPTC